jgi:predicted MFS family arabinose efflux permease
MARRILSIVVALIVALGLVMGFEYLGGFLFQHPDVDMKNPTTISDSMASMPIAAFLWVLLGYAVSSFIGGLIASLISGRTKVQPALIVGAMLMVGGIMMIIVIPYHPLWFIIASVFAYIPFAWFGHLLVRKKEKEKAEGHIPSSALK